MISRIVRVLFLAGRLISLAGAALTISVITIGTVEWVVLSFRYGLDWNVGIVPLVFVLQILLAIWIAWRVLRAEPTSLLYTLLLAFGGSFIVLYGWYFLLAGEGGMLIGTGNLLYLAAGLVVLCARMTSKLDTYLDQSRYPE